MDNRIPRNIEIFKIQNNCQALWFLIDNIHEMNQIVQSINVLTGALEKTPDSQDGDAGVSQHFVSLVYHVDYIWDYFGPILRLLWSDHCSRWESEQLSPSPLLAPTLHQSIAEYLGRHWTFTDFYNIRASCWQQSKSLPDVNNLWPQMGNTEYRQTGAPQVKQGFVKDYYLCTGTHYNAFLRCDAGVNNMFFLYFFSIFVTAILTVVDIQSQSVYWIISADSFTIYCSIIAWLVMKLFLHFVSVRKIDQVWRDKPGPDSLMLSQQTIVWWPASVQIQTGMLSVHCCDGYKLKIVTKQVSDF